MRRNKGSPSSECALMIRMLIVGYVLRSAQNGAVSCPKKGRTMLFHTSRRLSLSLFLGIAVSTGAYAQSGYQTINGTRVYTQIDQARGVATFSNECGSQTLTQRQLQAGAIPNQIIPCPRPQQSAPKADPGQFQREVDRIYREGREEFLRRSRTRRRSVLSRGCDTREE